MSFLNSTSSYIYMDWLRLCWVRSAKYRLHKSTFPSQRRYEELGFEIASHQIPIGPRYTLHTLLRNHHLYRSVKEGE
jgi:hypothetical protein